MKHSSTSHDLLFMGISHLRCLHMSLGLFSWSCGIHPTGPVTRGAQSCGVGSVLSLGTLFDPGPGKWVSINQQEERCPAGSRKQWWCVGAGQGCGGGQLLPRNAACSAGLLTWKSTHRSPLSQSYPSYPKFLTSRDTCSLPPCPSPVPGIPSPSPALLPFPAVNTSIK